MRKLTTLTDAQIESAFGDACCAEDLVFTQDSIESFDLASNSYAECGVAQWGERDGFRTLLLEGAQVRKGDQRRDVHVVDFGTVRAVCR